MSVNIEVDRKTMIAIEKIRNQKINTISTEELDLLKSHAKAYARNLNKPVDYVQHINAAKTIDALMQYINAIRDMYSIDPF